MKHLIIAAILLLAAWNGSVQNAVGSYMYRSGDKVRKQTVENISVDSTEKDFSFLRFFFADYLFSC